MVQDLRSVTPDALRQASERLNQVGVYADEERKFPAVSVLRSVLNGLEAELRTHGYNGGQVDFAAIEPPRDGVNFLLYDSSRILDATSAESVWKHDYQERWRARVAERVQDWVTRLNVLKATIASWLPPGSNIVDRPAVRMHEELMKRFKVPAAQMPVFDVVAQGRLLMRFQPKGLWTLGANGRVDLISQKGSWILVDKSEPMSSNADWQYYEQRNRTVPTVFNQAKFLELIG